MSLQLDEQGFVIGYSSPQCDDEWRRDVPHGYEFPEGLCDFRQEMEELDWPPMVEAFEAQYWGEE
jgi:hypothetical protein